jgi:hypothetical protein
VNEDEDFIVDDLLSNLNQKKKKINSKDKGRRGENTVVKTLIARFNKPFSRTIGSGNRGSQVNLTEEAKQIFTGDLICPHSFIFCVEIKHGYYEIDLCNALDGGNKTLDSFIAQATKDAGKINKKPLLCWKKDRCSCICFLKQKDLPDFRAFKFYLCYNDWVAVSFTELLGKEDCFFFTD